MWNLVPCPGIEPRAPALGVQCLSHWTTGKSPDLHLIKLSRFLNYHLLSSLLVSSPSLSRLVFCLTCQDTDLSFYFWSWCNTMPWEFFSLGGCKVPGDTTKKWREVSFPTDGSWPLESGRWERADQIWPISFLPFADPLLAVVSPVASLKRLSSKHWNCITLLCIFPHLLFLSLFLFPPTSSPR